LSIQAIIIAPHALVELEVSHSQEVGRSGRVPRSGRMRVGSERGEELVGIPPAV